MFKNRGYIKKAGQTDIQLGIAIKIKKIEGDDACFSNLTGTVTHPFAFGCTNKNWIGVYLDNGEKCNMRTSDIIIIEENFVFKK